MSKQQTAYLVVYLDTAKRPPVVTRASIHTVDARNLTRAVSSDEFAVTAMTAEGNTYETAVENLRTQLGYLPKVTDWLLELLNQ